MVVIKDMEMPKSCSECFIEFTDRELALKGPCYLNLDHRPEGCPLVEIDTELCKNTVREFLISKGYWVGEGGKRVR